MPKKKKNKAAPAAAEAVPTEETQVVEAKEAVTEPAATPAPAKPTASSSSALDKKKMAEMIKALQGVGIGVPPAGGSNDAKKPHQFWNTQPVPQMEEPAPSGDVEEGEIETKTVDQVRPTPYQLPANFEWSDCDMDDEETVSEVYTLLCENYVEDDDNMFRFDYSKPFLKWALMPPGFKKELHVGVRVATGKKKLVGFITGIPAEMTVGAGSAKTVRDMVEINFLCVHKKLRSKRLAPVLIKEITRRVNCMGVWQAVYTAGVVLPKPVAQNRYYHRSLNPKKLIEIGFSRLQKRMTMTRTQKLYRMPADTLIPGIRALEKRDIPACCKMLTDYLNQFKLHQNFNEAEFEHWFMPRKGVVNTYVVEDVATHEITDLCSFYSLPSTIIGHELHNKLWAAYSFYNVCNKHTLQEVMTDALILAKQLDFDVFNALNVMENENFLSELKFGIGDGHLQYYLYNWRCKDVIKPGEVGLVLL